MAIKAVIFDLFGVLTCTTSPELKIIGHWKLKPGIHDAMQRAVCGQTFTGWEKYLEGVVKAAGIEDTKDNREKVKGFVLSEVERGVKNVKPEVKKALQELKARGFTLGLVSNSYPGCRRILQENGLARFFKKNATVFSHEVGLTKQTPAIYRLCFNRLGVPPGNAIMVGDSLKNDILMSKIASNGKIGGILISKKPVPQAKRIGCAIIPGISSVPKTVNELNKPITLKRIVRKAIRKSRARRRI